MATMTPQVAAALARAAERKAQRVELLRDVRSGGVAPDSLVLDPPACLQGMFVFDYLRVVPRVGDGIVREINRKALLDQVNLAVALGELTPLRRAWLAEALRTRRWQSSVLASRPQG